MTSKLSPLELGPPKTLKEGAKRLRSFLFRLGLFLLAWLFIRWIFWPITYYTDIYWTDEAHVVMPPKPHDCDFSKAPMGKKECHFEKLVTATPDPKGGPTSVAITWEKVPE